MAPSIIFSIPPGPSTAQPEQSLLRLQHNIRQNLQSEALPRWTLEYRHSRETPIANGSAKSSIAAKTLHCLTLSWKPGKTWISIVDDSPPPPSSPSAAAAVPAAANTSPPSNNRPLISTSAIPTSFLDDFWSLLVLRLSPLWQPRGGGIVTVRDGLACRIADFVLRIGELKLIVPGAAAAGTVPIHRGTICQIVYAGKEIEGKVVADVIRGLWEIVGKDVGGREVYTTGEKGDDGDDEVIGWVEALRRDGR